MELILVRHAKAFERDASAWPDDSRRPLTAEGRAQFVRCAKRLRTLVPAVDLVESSGFVRAWQTALLLEEYAKWPKPARLERLEVREAPEDERAQLDALLRTVAAIRAIPVVVWVGHEPALSRFASLLLSGSPDQVSIDLRKGAVISLFVNPKMPDAKLANPTLAADTAPRATLRWMFTPSVVRKLTR